MANIRIGLAFSDTGGGHRSAMDAVQSALLEVGANEFRDDRVEIIAESVAEKTHPINRAFVDFYNYLLRGNNQRWMQYYYSFIQATRPNDSAFGYAISGPYFRRWLREIEADVIVSVHPMVNQYFVKALRDNGMMGKVKFFVVVTDPNGELWRGWACPEADLTIVPNELGKATLVSYGVPPERIKVIGMPVHPDFIKPPSLGKDEFREPLGLSKDRLTICINSGWAGGGNMLQIYEQLSKVRRQVQCIFLCGHNTALYERAKAEARKSSIPTAVLPFHDRISDLMSAVDLMVTKAGGLTTFESIARKLPMAFDMITKPMPQEEGTAEIVINQGLARPVTRPSDIIEIVEQLQPAEDRSTVKLPNAYCLDRVDAVYDIARTVLHSVRPTVKSTHEQVPSQAEPGNRP